MLVVNEKILNLEEVSTELEKRVAKEMNQMIQDYGLDQGKALVFTYPDGVVTPRKGNVPENIGKMNRPASFGIQLSASVGTKTGVANWRWCESSRTISAGKTKYNPTQVTFTGNLALDISRVDLIYFLLNIFQRTVGGKNQDTSKAPLIKLAERDKDLQKLADQKRNNVFIENAIWGEDGLTEDQLRELGFSMKIPDSMKRELNDLRSLLDKVVSTSSVSIEMIKELYSKTKVKPTAKKEEKEKTAETVVDVLEFVRQCEAKEIIKYIEEGQSKRWHFLKWEEGSDDPVIGEKIIGIAPSMVGETVQDKLAIWLAKHADVFEVLRASVAKRGEEK